MYRAVSTVASGRQSSLRLLASRLLVEAPSLTEWAAALATSILLILSFPDFNLWPLAWIGMTPLLLTLAQRPSPVRAFALGWFTGTVFFYGSCYWLTYSMIHFGGLPAWLAYLLLIPGALVLGLFPATFALILAFALQRWGSKAIFLAPFAWTSLEWARLEVTGQLWNAIGYSQAYHPVVIQLARWGGVYAIGFLILLVNSAVAFALLDRCRRAFVIAGAVCLITFALIALGEVGMRSASSARSLEPELLIVAIQPNVPMDPSVAGAEMRELTAMHISESTKGLQQLPSDKSRLVIWPESPMTFAYGADEQLRSLLAAFTQQNHTSLLFNSQERAPDNGLYNSAILLNEEGREISQYDKIRLLPFGEYVPLPRWVPGASLITAIVGDFSAGDKYTLFQTGPVRAGVFICIESAYPSIARTFTREGADVLINISNDGYLGPTAVMRQHLANAIFRAVENGRPLLRVTNSGISAYISASGEVKDETGSFQTAVRTWKVSAGDRRRTFYSNYGDLFPVLAGMTTLLCFVLTLIKVKSRG